jgi:predicted ester cyclase
MIRIATFSSVFGACWVVACGGAEPPAASPSAPVVAAQGPAPAPVTATASAGAMPAAAPATPTPPSAAAQGQALAAAWSAHDPDKIAALYAEGGILRIPALPDFVGREAVKAQSKQALLGSADLKITLTRAWSQKNVVAAEWVATLTDTGGQNGSKPTNRPVGFQGMSIITVGDDGLIKSDHRYFDMMTQVSQLDSKAKAGTFRPVQHTPSGPLEAHTSMGGGSEASDLAVVNAFYDTIDAHKVDATLNQVTNEATIEDYSQPAPMTSRAAAKAYLGTFFTAFPDLKQTRDVLIAVDGYVVSEGVLTGTHKGPLGLIKASNKPVSLHFVDVFRVKDGKISQAWSYGNNVELLVEIGAMPPLGAK